MQLYQLKSRQALPILFGQMGNGNHARGTW